MRVGTWFTVSAIYRRFLRALTKMKRSEVWVNNDSQNMFSVECIFVAVCGIVLVGVRRNVGILEHITSIRLSQNNGTVQ